MLTVIASVAFAVATVWFAIGKSWPLVLVAGGLALWALDVAGPIRIGG